MTDLTDRPTFREITVERMFDFDAPSVPPGWEPSDSIVADLDDAHLETCRQQRRLLSLIAEADRRDAWLDSGARDMAHWVSIRYGVSWWKARRWIVAGHALEGLPLVSDALTSGRLSLDKVVEQARFATAETEARLIPWADRVSVTRSGTGAT